MTLKCHFMLKAVFIVGLTDFSAPTFGDRYVKTNEELKILPDCQRKKCSPGTLVSAGILFMRIVVVFF